MSKLEISQADLRAAWALLGGDPDRYEDGVSLHVENGVVTVTYARKDESGHICVGDPIGRPLHETFEFAIRSELDERG